MTVTHNYVYTSTATHGRYSDDQADRLTDVTVWTGQYRYGYDGDGVRQSKALSGTVEAYTWDTAEGLPQLLQDGSTRYVMEPDGLPLEQVSVTGTVLYYYQDQLGSTRALLTGAAQSAGVYSYNAFGTVAYKSGSANNPFGYAGQYTDPETGFQYLQARYYDPATSQFLTRDPLVDVTGQPYSYANDDPLNATDPTGLQCYGFDPLCGLRETVTPLARQAVIGVNTGLTNFVNSGLSNDVNTGFSQAVIGIGGVFLGTPTVAGGPASQCDTGYYVQAARDQADLNTDTNVASLGLLGAGAVRSAPALARGIGRGASALAGRMASRSASNAGDATALDGAINSVPTEYGNLYGGKSGILAEVDSNGVLNLVIEKGPGTPRGSAMFDEAMSVIGPRVKAIRGTWNTGMPDNLNTFNQAIRSGMSPEAAARATFTGKMASRYGFTGVQIEDLAGTPGAYTNVKVLFTK